MAAAITTEPTEEVATDSGPQNVPAGETTTQANQGQKSTTSPPRTFTIFGFKLSLLQLVLLLAVLGALAYYGFKKYKGTPAGVTALQPVA